MYRISVSFWGVLEFTVKAVIIGIPVLSWLGYIQLMGGHFIEASAQQRILLIFVVGMLALPLSVMVWALYEETTKLEKWVKELVEKEGLSYQGVPIRALGVLRLIRRRFPSLGLVNVNKFSWWLLLVWLPWALIFHFGAGTAFGQ